MQAGLIDVCALAEACAILSATMYQSISFRKSSPPHDRQLDMLISNGKQQVDNYWGELTFQNRSIDTFCEMKSLDPYESRLIYVEWADGR